MSQEIEVHSWGHPDEPHHIPVPVRIEWYVTTKDTTGVLAGPFDSQEDAADFAATWNAGYPPEDGYVEFVATALEIPALIPRTDPCPIAPELR